MVFLIRHSSSIAILESFLYTWWQLRNITVMLRKLLNCYI